MLIADTRRRIVRAALALAAVTLVALPAAAQGQARRPGAPEPIPSIDDRTNGLKKIEGFFTLYADDAAGKLWMEIPKLNVEVLYSTGLATGLGSNDIGLDRGMLTGSRIVSFERAGPRILMVQPNYRFRALTESAAEAKTVRDAFARSVLWSFPIGAQTGDRTLVDVTDFIVRDSNEMAGRLQPGSYRFEAGRSSIFMPGTAAFPKNTEMEAELTFARQPAGGGAAAAAEAEAPAGSSRAWAAWPRQPKPQASVCTTRSRSCRMPATKPGASIRVPGSAHCRTRTTRRCRANR